MSRRLLRFVFCLALAALAPAPSPAGSAPEADLASAARSFADGDRSATVERGTERIYPYGGDLTPEVQCAPLRACSIQFSPGEHATAIVIGDPGRWIVETPQLAASASGLIAVKPRQCGILTNLLVVTNFDRVYDVMLNSPPCGGLDTSSRNPDLPFMSRVRFYFPDQILRELAPPPEPPAPACPPPEPAAPAAFDPQELACDFRWRASRHFPGRPDAICTHRGRTLIYWPAEEASGETPVLFGLGEDGRPRQVNYTFDGGLYLIGEVLERGRLVLERSKRRQVALTFWRTGDGH